ncbi:zinc finger, RING/FYVE/PHD-type [Artemisia annua]|uniref:Zinc finger, RING/FYVE/PHD-type n=1 Tax=Artemisia annua TaxID=35608 RepID=A0A2U1KL56_ARTAN|nr:zinc finger, RING/FYVE/PHD-type [Artemisia annua]
MDKVVHMSLWIRPSNGKPIDGLEVPVMKDDAFIHDSMYRNDIVFGPRKDPPPHVFDPVPAPPAPFCSICFQHWTTPCFPSSAGGVVDASDTSEQTVGEGSRVTSWFNPVAGKTYHEIQTMDVLRSTDCKRYEFDLCPICLKPWTLDKMHQMSCLPCGHMFGMSCLKDWMGGRSSDKCPQCYKNFSLESVRLLYATRLCIPAAAFQKASIRRFSFSKLGFTAFKQYERELRTIALNNRFGVLKQRADVLGRQNDAMKRRTELLTRMANAEKQADVLERQNDAMKRQTELLNQMTDEEEWAEASEQQFDAEKRAEALRRRADALGQRADEYLRKAEEFGQQAKALRQQAKSLRQLVDSYLLSSFLAHVWDVMYKAMDGRLFL